MLDSQSRRTKQRHPATEPDRQRSVDVTPDSLTGAAADDEWVPGLNSSELFRCQKLENNSCLMTFVFRWSRGTAEIQSCYSDFLLVEPPAFVQTFIYSIWLSEGGNPGLDHPFPTSSRINDNKPQDLHGYIWNHSENSSLHWILSLFPILFILFISSGGLNKRLRLLMLNRPAIAVHSVCWSNPVFESWSIFVDDSWSRDRLWLEPEIITVT